MHIKSVVYQWLEEKGEYSITVVATYVPTRYAEVEPVARWALNDFVNKLLAAGELEDAEMDCG